MKQRAGALLSSISVDRSAKKTLSVQLYVELRDLIVDGALPPGARLPATRTLALEVGVSRTTTINAVDRLISEGLLEARIGAGTFVSDALSSRPATRDSLDSTSSKGTPPRLSHAAQHALPLFAPRSRLPNDTHAFVTALPELDAFPMARWAKVSARHWRKSRGKVAGYGNPFGYGPLREAIARQLGASRGIKCSPEQIFITNGAQEAFGLVAGLLANPGEAVWFENPGAIGARNSFIANGSRIVPVEVDKEGLIVSDGLKKAPHFRIAFVTPSHQQPLGNVMSLPRRLQLLKAADEADAMIIEDDYDGDFYYGQTPPATMKSIDSAGRVIYVGTFSKSLFPALRLGYLLVPDRLVHIFEHICQTWFSGVPTANQAITADFMDEGYFATHLRTMRQLYKERHNTLLEEGRHIEGMLKLLPTRSGFHATGLLDTGLDADKVVKAAAEAGIIVVPLSRYGITPLSNQGLVIGFGCSSSRSIRQGIESLHYAIKQCM